MRRPYDIAFLGGGPAGYQGAIRVAQMLHGQAIHLPPEAQSP
jgi:pyruvate/2-oxoglutarate dehydrogenase complex dihydrolipoamide dehydrogenase (E3) component